MRYNKWMTSLRLPVRAGIITILFLSAVSFVLSAERGSEEGLLTVAYLDVGQGDATFIESPSGTQVLIDGGKNGLVLRGLSKAMGFFDRTIDVVLITHPDLDHIGGLIDVFQKYEVATVVMTENVSDTSAYELLQEKIEGEGAEIIIARRGQTFELGLGEQGMATIHILFPDRDPTNLESNTSSIVAELTYGESELIFSGDSPQSIEEYLVSIDAPALQTDVLKVGHHGSKTSTAETYVTAVSPSLAIISAGKDNSYGHPHTEVTDRLTAHNIPYKNTADEGSIVLVSDGKEIYLK